jgi:hypothetical protein
MFILNDVNLSNYARGRDRVKRKSRGNLLRNAAIGVGGLAVAGGLGYIALRGKNKSVTKPPVTTVNKSPVIDKRKANSELVAKRREILNKEISNIPNDNGKYESINTPDTLSMTNQEYNMVSKKSEPSDINERGIKMRDYIRERVRKQKRDMFKPTITKTVKKLKDSGRYFKSGLSLNNF